MDLNADLLLAHKVSPVINLDREDQCVLTKYVQRH